MQRGSSPRWEQCIEFFRAQHLRFRTYVFGRVVADVRRIHPGNLAYYLRKLANGMVLTCSNVVQIILHSLIERYQRIHKIADKNKLTALVSVTPERHRFASVFIEHDLPD